MCGQVKTIISELTALLRVEYGDRLVKLIVFGSEARGDADPDSDIDVMAVLKGPIDVGAEVSRVGQIRTDISLRYGRLVSCIFMDESRFLTRNGPLLRNVRREGIAV
jgi:predicted nucleotidyltransferase